ncbi:phosphate-starvation-inducible PsiE family protein [Hippea alviniae]|uniref:phosphate-starvation-inducible PsiE family protein n=1 Tax=Hippea alviniae TaxID=1279027 RepID=UPI0003F4FA87|nr:phosphate-starvation-inducible PsiE family protein [Hippea alviniae]
MKVDLVKKAMDVILYILSILILIVIVFYLIKLVWELKDVVMNFPPSNKTMSKAVEEVLNLFVLIEFFRGAISYFDFERIKLSYIADAAIVFILRELMIATFYHELEFKMAIAYSIVIAAVIGMRTLTIIYTPDREKFKKLIKNARER